MDPNSLKRAVVEIVNGLSDVRMQDRRIAVQLSALQYDWNQPVVALDFEQVRSLIHQAMRGLWPQYLPNISPPKRSYRPTDPDEAHVAEYLKLLWGAFSIPLTEYWHAHRP